MTDERLTDPRESDRDNPVAQEQDTQPGVTETMMPTPDHG